MLAIVMVVLVQLYACNKKSTGAEDGAISRVTIRSGYNRVQLSFNVGNSKADAFLVTHSGSSEVIRINASQAVNDSIKLFIENLEQGYYTFKVEAVRVDGSSIGGSQIVNARTYGDRHISGLATTPAADLVFIRDETPYLSWSGSFPTDFIGTEIRYTNMSNQTTSIRSYVADGVSVLRGYKEGTAFEYRSMYLPANSVDTFFSASIKTPAPAYFASLANKYIIEKSGMVSEITEQSRTKLHNHVEYSTLRFKTATGNPQSLFIVAADLSKANLGLSTLMPDNGTAFKIQTVKQMAQKRAAAGQKVLAAVNGDFFDWTPVEGRPWGPVVVEGNVIKNFLKAGINSSYIGVKKDGSLALGVASSLMSTDYAGFHNLIGAGETVLYMNKTRRIYNDTDRHPRTMAGFTDDGILYLIVVDGRRNDYSIGMTLDELSKVIGSLNVSFATNLDGGGSSTMVVNQNNGLAVTNRFSDATERAIANAIAIVEK
ncbi:phosphodiester glycosidase family protein [Niabella yanshanensis]|uniref:Phosphodiester glycosidase family protein n=1 Tax=Niabella yanshanensis TaxID=577386 RepID=A0ABZ0W7M7_9BACT|nr:phosphodiester glycosidase family protein [Niabella yanshanensis]WQD38608.1 phosphodiester glycosidase family protein [Niabella yanshanensis]